MSRDLDIDLIDRINPSQAAYSILAKAMSADTLKQVQAAITVKKSKLTYEQARELAVRALSWRRERGRSPELTAADAFERLMAEGIAVLNRYEAARV